MAGKVRSFRVGRVRAERRGKVWYLSYHEHGRRQRPRVGPDRDAARQLAAQINAQLELGAPPLLSFEPITIAELQWRWLEHHEHVLRSSVQTIRRYRTATRHLLQFIESTQPGCRTSVFGTRQAEAFVRHLRSIKVAPNGHPKARKRPLLDNGIKYVLECCRTMFRYALKRRHLSPYAENPFTELDLDRLPVDNARPVRILTPVQERQFLEACDDWQFPVFLTFMLTGLRPSELAHLLLPEDLDFDTGVLRVRNKPRLHWQVKTRNERDIPLVAPLVEVLRGDLRDRTTGPVFLRRRFRNGEVPALADRTAAQLEREIEDRIVEAERVQGRGLSRADQARIARGVWGDAGSVKTDMIRLEFIRLTKGLGLPDLTAPKALRHGFATALQEGNVDPLIRCELMGHSVGVRGGSHGLGMTATYTHTRPEVRRAQLARALLERPAAAAAQAWIQRDGSTRDC